VLEHERGTLSEQLRKQDKVLEKMRELRGQDCDGLMALVEREVQEVTNIPSPVPLVAGVVGQVVCILQS